MSGIALLDPIVIVEALRTPIGLFQGDLQRLSAPELGSAAITSLLALTGLDPKHVDDVIMGCVLPAGQGQGPARQVVMGSGLNPHTKAMLVNKVCGSGMQAVILGAQQLHLGDSEVILAGGMESMSNAPLLKKRPPKGQEPEAKHYADHLFLDGLEDAYNKNASMGMFAEKTAERYGFTRKKQDDYAILSLTRAQQATTKGYFAPEVVPIIVKTPEDTKEVVEDGGVTRGKVEKIPLLKAAFKEKGTITAASSSGLSDGAAVLLLMKESKAKSLGLPSRAKIVAYAGHAHEPEWFTTAPIESIKKLLKKTGWTKKDVDLFEINEAFAAVTLAAIEELDLDIDKVNIHGGACALGHPLGASGARIIVTLLNALEQTGKKKGIAAICIGGGEALALAIERV
jgi:acetyl-CoA C-acetyltransferase